MDHEKPSAGGVTTRPKHESICSRTARSGKASRRLCGGGQRITFLGDVRCSKAIPDFLATTEVGRTAGPSVADEELGSEASEWGKREREEYLAQVAEEERALGEGAED